VALGGDLVVNVTASDNVHLSRVSVSFDINGNGQSDAGESINATPIGGNNYQAVFHAVAGPAATRPIGAIAWDDWSNSTRTAINVHVNSGTVAVPNVVGLTQA